MLKCYYVTRGITCCFRLQNSPQCYDCGAFVTRTIFCIVLHSKNVRLFDLFVGSVRASSLYDAVLNLYFVQLRNKKIINPVAEWSKALFCSRSSAEIIGSNPTGVLDVCFECCVLFCRSLCDELITRPEESYRMWCVVVSDL